MTGFVILAVLVVIALAAPRYGVDSRLGAVGRRHTVRADVRAAFARLEQALSAVTPPASTRR